MLWKSILGTNYLRVPLIWHRMLKLQEQLPIKTKQVDLSAGSVSNTATVILMVPQQLNQTTVKSNSNTTRPKPGAAIAKSAYPTTYDAIGQTITYTYKVTNSGNADISAPITVTDDKFGTVYNTKQWYP